MYLMLGRSGTSRITTGLTIPSNLQTALRVSMVAVALTCSGNKLRTFSRSKKALRNVSPLVKQKKALRSNHISLTNAYHFLTQ